MYAVPGVPSEMREMVARAIIPDLQRRSGSVATIRSRVLRTWGLAESAVAEVVAPRIEALELAGNPTIAFLASGMDGIKVRITAKGPDSAVGWRPASTPRKPSSGRCWATRCSGWTMRRWKLRWPSCCASAG